MDFHNFLKERNHTVSFYCAKYDQQFFVCSKCGYYFYQNVTFRDINQIWFCDDIDGWFTLYNATDDRFKLTCDEFIIMGIIK